MNAGTQPQELDPVEPVEFDGDVESAIPLCTRCLQPVHSTTTRCPHCNEPIGSSTMLPFESIHAEWTFLARASQSLTRHWRILLPVIMIALWALVAWKG